MTLHEATSQAAAHVEKRDAELLLAHILQCDRVYLAAHPDAALTTVFGPTTLARFDVHSLAALEEAFHVGEEVLPLVRGSAPTLIRSAA